MKNKLVPLGVILGIAVAATLGLTGVSASGQGTAQAEKPKPAPTAKPKPRPKKKVQAMRGVPKGVGACLDHLVQMASADPLIDYAGHPEEIVNNGLLWNNPKSRCSIGSDAALRKKVLDMAAAWRRKDSASVRSLLAEIKGAAPQK
ncbi:MAG TPA: hypothetical protein VJH03_26720 [Blastocatellia bacterium]|nr:hypothetical protein [Blastocatellia bacterium]